MTITIYGIRNCDTTRKALKWLDENGHDYRFHDYRKDGVPEQRLRAWIDQLGWETVINKRGTTWRKLDEQTRANMDAEGAVEAALHESALIKRPIVETGNMLLVGFKPDEWQQNL